MKCVFRARSYAAKVQGRDQTTSELATNVVGLYEACVGTKDDELCHRLRRGASWGARQEGGLGDHLAAAARHLGGSIVVLRMQRSSLLLGQSMTIDDGVLSGRQVSMEDTPRLFLDKAGLQCAIKDAVAIILGEREVCARSGRGDRISCKHFRASCLATHLQEGGPHDQKCEEEREEVQLQHINHQNEGGHSATLTCEEQDGVQMEEEEKHQEDREHPQSHRADSPQRPSTSAPTTIHDWLFGRHVVALVEYVQEQSSSARCITTTFGNMLSLRTKDGWNNSKPTSQGPHHIPPHIQHDLDLICSGPCGSPGPLFPKEWDELKDNGQILMLDEFSLEWVYANGDCGFLSVLACAYPERFVTPLEEATAESAVTAFALRSAVQDALPDSQSYLKYIGPKGVLQAATALGLEATIFEVFNDGIRATWSTLPNRQLDAQALIFFWCCFGSI